MLSRSVSHSRHPPPATSDVATNLVPSLLPSLPPFHFTLNPPTTTNNREATILEAHAAAVSLETCALLQQHGGSPPPRWPTQVPHNPAHLVTTDEDGCPCGVATMRLAQVLLAGFCAKLPGSDRCVCCVGTCVDVCALLLAVLQIMCGFGCLLQCTWVFGHRLHAANGAVHTHV